MSRLTHGFSTILTWVPASTGLLEVVMTKSPALRPLTDPLIGVEHTAEAISKALEGVDTSRYITNLTTDRFISLIARQAATT